MNIQKFYTMNIMDCIHFSIHILNLTNYPLGNISVDIPRFLHMQDIVQPMTDILSLFQRFRDPYSHTGKNRGVGLEL